MTREKLKQIKSGLGYGLNLKTINGNEIQGTGDITISGGGEGGAGVSINNLYAPMLYAGPVRFSNFTEGLAAIKGGYTLKWITNFNSLFDGKTIADLGANCAGIAKVYAFDSVTMNVEDIHTDQAYDLTNKYSSTNGYMYAVAGEPVITLSTMGYIAENPNKFTFIFVPEDVHTSFVNHFASQLPSSGGGGITEERVNELIDTKLNAIPSAEGGAY